MNDPVHIQDETALTTAPLDTDVVLVERALAPPYVLGGAVSTFAQKVSDFFKWLGLTNVSGLIRFPAAGGISLKTGNDGCSAGVLKHAQAGFWANVGGQNGTSRATITCTRITANSIVFLTFQSPPLDVGTGKGSVHLLPALTQVGNVFKIESSDPAEDRDIAWMIIEPY